MKRLGLLIALFAAMIFVLPSLPAQDEKKNDAKTEKKDEAKKDEPKKDEPKKDEPKKDEPKKDEKKDPEKKDPEKKDEKKDEPKKVEKEKLSYSTMFRTKIISANAENGREFTVEMQELDPKKVYEMNIWEAQRKQQLTQELFNAQRQKGAQYAQSMAAYNRNIATFQMEKAKRQSNLTSAKNLEVRAAENAKVRTMFLPVEFDDEGKQKKWTKKEIEAKKDKTGLPGYPAEWDALKSGQYVDIYMAKPTAAAKAPAKKKAAPGDDDPPPAMQRQEFVLIVIVAEAAAPK